MTKIGPVLAKNLIAYCGGAEEVFKTSKKDLLKIPGISQGIIANWATEEVFKTVEKEVRFIEKNSIKVLSYKNQAFPQRLLNYDSSPILLYSRGNADLNHYRTVAIVGTRSPTTYGNLMCERIVDGLAKYNVLIISGLAYGIDALAHRKSVELNIPNVGVLGHGLDRYYPAANTALAKKMIENGGVLTEFMTETRPDRENFPMRNRIIAGLSDAVIVVESKRKGGSIITAEFANEYNKDVFAVPGFVNEEFSEGCNKLIKQNKANLLESAEDIAYIMRWDEIDAGKVIQKQLFVELDETESILIDIIRENKQISIDAITSKIGLMPSATSAILLTLEFKGVIRALPGKKYIIL